MSAQFVAEEGTLEGLTLTLEGGEEWIMGSDPEQASLLLEDPEAEGKQVLCRQTPTGITIENLSSTHSIKVNDEVVEEPQVLRDNDTVLIGQTLFRFKEVAAVIDEESEIEDEMEAQEDTILDESELQEDSLAQVHFDLGSQSRWVLKVIAGPNTGAEVALEAGQKYTVGTDTGSCDVVFQDVSVSRQHAQVAITSDDRVIINDLESRNGVLIDGDPIEDEEELGSNNVVTVGTTAFVVYDTESESATVVSPLIPKAPAIEREETEEETEAKASKKEEKKESKGSMAGSLIILVFVLGVFGTIGYATTTLFQQEEVLEEEVVDVKSSLNRVIAKYPGVKHSFNRNTGTLLLLGHVLTATERNQLRYSLQDPSFSFIRRLDDNVVIDEYVWQDTNQILAQNPAWQGITVHNMDKIPGAFVISGSLKTQEQYDSLMSHINRNFPYLDKLRRSIIVEEALVNQADSILRDNGFNDVTVEINNGEITLVGTMSYEMTDQLDKVLAEINDLDGIKGLKNFIVELEPEQAMVDLTGQYEVTGYSMQDNVSLNVVINGRILSRGDTLDGMTITSIRPNAIFLERDGFKFRINYTP